MIMACARKTRFNFSTLRPATGIDALIDQHKELDFRRNTTFGKISVNCAAPV
jgi:hypothetical protein